MQANPLHQHGRAVVFHLVCLVWIVASASTAWGHGQVSAPEEADGDRTIVFPDTPGYQTLVVDLHTHSAFSDGHVWPNIRVGEALRDGLDAMAVTEHLDYPPHEAQHRPVNLVLAEARTADALREAMFAKRTLVWFRDLLIGRQAELDAILQASLQVTGASYRPNTQVLDITVSNGSEVNFRLRNLTAMTFMDHAQHIVVPAHDSLTFSLKPGAALEQVTLKFAVENALLAPRKNATIVFNIQP